MQVIRHCCDKKLIYLSNNAMHIIVRSRYETTVTVSNDRCESYKCRILVYIYIL